MHATLTPVTDPRVSFRARGVWATLLTMADENNDVPSAFGRLREISSREGQHAIRTALSELEELGYAVKTLERTPTGKLAGVMWRLVPEQPLESVEREGSGVKHRKAA